MNNLLLHPLITVDRNRRLTLPGLLAAMARDEIEFFPKLRPHQAASWHMFLVQLGALSLASAVRSDIPVQEDEWLALLRGFSSEYPDDEPWCLVVENRTRPAFLQAAVPEGIVLANEVLTPDGLDLLITSRNHDLKQMVARECSSEDWLFALVSLQTGEGYGGSGNQGIARMNGGSSSRAMVTLAPLAGNGSKEMSIRPGAWFARDVRILLETRKSVLENTEIRFADPGIGLTWLQPWPEGVQLDLQDLDIWFIEICRRIRLKEQNGRILAFKGTSRETRIAAKANKGNLEDPWAPVHKQEGKSLTIGDEGEFDYQTLCKLLLSGEWELPLLARRASFEGRDSRLAIVAQALARGNSKTGGYRSRIIPIESRQVSRGWGDPNSQEMLRLIAQEQAKAISRFDKALGYALVLAAASGDKERINREAYAFTTRARSHLGRFADSIFFEHLWRRFDAESASEAARTGEETAFLQCLWQQTQAIFEQFLPEMPCHSLYRMRAEVRARRALVSRDLRENYPELVKGRKTSEVSENA